MRMLITLALCCTALASPAGSQREPLSIRVQPGAVDVHGDTVVVTLGVQNRATSSRDLWLFTVEAPVPARTIKHLGAPTEWHVFMTKHYGISVATWGFLGDHLAPGRSSPPLVFSALGLPGLVRYWAEPWIVPDTVDSDYVEASAGPPGPWNTAADSGVTVGVVPFPNDRSRGALLGRMRALLQESCARSWVDSAGVCNSLSEKLSHDDMGALLNELEAQRGKHVNDLAYFLLGGNVRALPTQ